MKLPPHVFANTLRFYEHTLGLTVVERIGYWIASPANVVHLVTEPGQ